MTILDVSIVNVALPTIAEKLHFSRGNLQWVVTAYALTFGGFLLLGGRAADLLGRRRILMLGLGLFSAASLAAALATGAGLMIGARAVQGIGAAIMLPAALSIVMNMFQEGAERNKALGIWGGLGAGGATVGVIAAFLLIERRVTDPILPLSIFGLRTLAGANTAGLLLGASFYAFIFVGTLYMQQVLHYSALQSGLAWLAASLTSIALAGLSQALVTRGGAKLVMATGMTLIGTGVIWATQAPVHGHFLANLAGPM